MAEEAASSHGVEEECWEQEINMYQSDHVPQQRSPSWYSDISGYLAQGILDPALTSRQKRVIGLKYASYQLIQGKLFKKHYDGVMLRCLDHDEAQKILIEMHDRPAGGHFSGDTTAHNIMRAGYYWPTLFGDAHAYVRKCTQCQKFANREARPATPLLSVAMEEPFQQWGLDVIGEIIPHSPSNIDIFLLLSIISPGGLKQHLYAKSMIKR